MAKDVCPLCGGEKDRRSKNCKGCPSFPRKTKKYSGICCSCGSLCDKRAIRCKQCGLEYRKSNIEKCNWIISTQGYLVRRSNNGDFQLQHRFIMEQHLGRKLETNEHVHHKNGVKTDNRLTNLELLIASEHHKLHVDPIKASEWSYLGHKKRWGYEKDKDNNL